MKKSKWVLLLVALVVLIGVIAWFTTPRNYADCVLKNVPTSASAGAAEIIADACYRKFKDD